MVAFPPPTETPLKCSLTPCTALPHSPGLRLASIKLGALHHYARLGQCVTPLVSLSG